MKNIIANAKGLAKVGKPLVLFGAVALAVAGLCAVVGTVEKAKAVSNLTPQRYIGGGGASGANGPLPLSVTNGTSTNFMLVLDVSQYRDFCITFKGSNSITSTNSYTIGIYGFNAGSSSGFSNLCYITTWTIGLTNTDLRSTYTNLSSGNNMLGALANIVIGGITNTSVGGGGLGNLTNWEFTVNGK